VSLSRTRQGSADILGQQSTPIDHGAGLGRHGRDAESEVSHYLGSKVEAEADDRPLLVHLVVDQDSTSQARTRRSVATLLNQLRSAANGQHFAGDAFDTVVVEVSLPDSIKGF
jgi:hypothetical protein